MTSTGWSCTLCAQPLLRFLCNADGDYILTCSSPTCLYGLLHARVYSKSEPAAEIRPEFQPIVTASPAAVAAAAAAAAAAADHSRPGVSLQDRENMPSFSSILAELDDDLKCFEDAAVPEVGSVYQEPTETAPPLPTAITTTSMVTMTSVAAAAAAENGGDHSSNNKDDINCWLQEMFTRPADVRESSPAPPLQPLSAAGVIDVNSPATAVAGPRTTQLDSMPNAAMSRSSSSRLLKRPSLPGKLGTRPLSASPQLQAKTAAATTTTTTTTTAAAAAAAAAADVRPGSLRRRGATEDPPLSAVLPLAVAAAANMKQKGSRRNLGVLAESQTRAKKQPARSSGGALGSNGSIANSILRKAQARTAMLRANVAELADETQSEAGSYDSGVNSDLSSSSSSSSSSASVESGGGGGATATAGTLTPIQRLLHIEEAKKRSWGATGMPGYKPSAISSTSRLKLL